MIDTIKNYDTAIIVVIMIACVTFLSFTSHYEKEVSLFFTGMAGYILGKGGNK